MLNKPKVTPRKSVSEYIQERMNDAADRGYNNTRIWFRKGQLEEAEKLLVDSDVPFEVVAVEENSSQLEVSW